jgi:hypothetical protein
MFDFQKTWQIPVSQFVYHILPEEVGADAVKRGGLDGFGTGSFRPNIYLFTSALEYNDGSLIRCAKWDANNRLDPSTRDLARKEGWLMVVRVRLDDIQKYYGDAFQRLATPANTEKPYEIYGLICDFDFEAVNAEFFEFYDPILSALYYSADQMQ